jgi:hypothetical protein
MEAVTSKDMGKFEVDAERIVRIAIQPKSSPKDFPPNEELIVIEYKKDRVSVWVKD